MITLFASHEVSDYDKWKALFGSQMNLISEKHGIQDTKVYRTLDSNRVIGTHTFNTLEDAQKHLAMMEAPEGQAMAEQNGVVLPAIIWLVEDVTF